MSTFEKTRLIDYYTNRSNYLFECYMYYDFENLDSRVTQIHYNFQCIAKLSLL
jgi:hypothetical protein